MLLTSTLPWYRYILMFSECVVEIEKHSFAKFELHIIRRGGHYSKTKFSIVYEYSYLLAEIGTTFGSKNKYLEIF